MSAPDNPPLFSGAYGQDRQPTYHTAVTLRDLFAAAAMVAYESDSNADRSFGGAAALSYQMADAMLAERAKATGETE